MSGDSKPNPKQQLNPKDWKLTYDGETVSLHPSIGNWSFNCQSHYWIRHSKVVWSEKWSKKKIEFNRLFDHRTSAENISYGAVISELKIEKAPDEQKIFGVKSKLGLKDDD